MSVHEEWLDRSAVPAGERVQARAVKRQWLAERDYRVVEAMVGEVERDVKNVLDTLAVAIKFTPSP